MSVKHTVDASSAGRPLISGREKLQNCTRKQLNTFPESQNNNKTFQGLMQSYLDGNALIIELHMSHELCAVYYDTLFRKSKRVMIDDETRLPPPKYKNQMCDH